MSEARKLCGSSPWLDLEERDYRGDLESGIQAAQTDVLPAAGNAWEHYTIGRWLMQHGSLSAADREFAAAINLQPDEFWAHFQRTRCAFQLKNYDEALISATVCIALTPRSAECYFNRALCHESLGQDEPALADFSRALELDPNFSPAALARGKVFVRLQQFAKAESDLETALTHGSRPSDVYFQLARLGVAQHDTAKARIWLQKSLADDPANDAAIALEMELAAKP